MKIFKPDLMLNSFLDVDVKELSRRGIRLLITDIDNTLVPHNFPNPTHDVKEFFNTLSENNINVCFMSNNSRERAEVFNRDFGFNVIAKAGKPKKSGYIKAMKLYGVDNTQTAAIGDQVFTDIWGGNRAGVYTILVNPVCHGGEGAFIAFKRMLEKLFI